MNEWLPDWTDPTNYPDPETTPMEEWAWEFLRRNPSYQADYKRAVSALCAFEQIRFNESRIAHGPSIRSSDKHKSEKYEEVLKLAIDCARLVESRYEVLFQLTNCHEWPDPALSYRKAVPRFLMAGHPKIWNFFAPSLGKERYGTHVLSGCFPKNLFSYMDEEMNKEACLANESTRPNLLHASARELTIQISLERPLPEQLEVIKKIANAQQKKLIEWGIVKKSRKESGRYAGYLQILDAIESGVKKQKILDIIFPNVINEYPDQVANKNFHNWKVAANKLRDFGYLDILKLCSPLQF